MQIFVSKILNECGFKANVELRVSTARGEVEIDVFAEEEIKGRKYILICECKYWKSAIPQTVVHGFRTVVNDIGANIGYIITTSDFQKGAESAAKFTNVELVSWEEFQNKFFESWFESFFITEITKELDPLMTYIEPFQPKWVETLSLDDKERYYQLKEKYQEIGYIVMVYFSTYSRMLTKKEIPKLPLSQLIPDARYLEGKLPSNILNEHGYKEFLEKIIYYGKVGIAEFRSLKAKYKVDQDDE